jgi:hypothetical protein
MRIRARLVLTASAVSLLSITAVGHAATAAAIEPSRLALAASTPLTLALATVSAPANVEVAGVHYRPRSRGNYFEDRQRLPESSGVSQVHLGYFDPDGDQSSRLDIGVRGGPVLDRMVQLGLGVDWFHKQENISSISSTTPGPGGVPIEVKQDIARASVNMFPIMAFVQVQGPDDMGVIPYFGLAGGYEVMLLSGDDFQTGESFEGTFSGWGWQLWGGAGVPLGGRTRLNGEVFVNGAELGRDATDPNTGNAVHETVKGDGMGLRFGLAWGF